MWRVKGGRLTVKIATPKGTSGVVELPGSGSIRIDGRPAEQIEGIKLEGGNHVLSRRMF